MQWQWTISPSDYDVRWNWILYDSWQQPAQWLDREASRHFPKQNLHQKKVLIIVWWSAADLIHYNFWIPAKPLYLRSMLSKSMKCSKSYNTCSWHWLTEGAQFFSQQHSTAHCTINIHFKSWMNWATKFCLIHHIHLTSQQPTTTSSSILTTFCWENASTTSRRQKMLFKSSSNPKHGF